MDKYMIVNKSNNSTKTEYFVRETPTLFRIYCEFTYDFPLKNPPKRFRGKRIKETSIRRSYQRELDIFKKESELFNEAYHIQLFAGNELKEEKKCIGGEILDGYVPDYIL